MRKTALQHGVCFGALFAKTDIEDEIEVGVYWRIISGGPFLFGKGVWLALALVHFWCGVVGCMGWNGSLVLKIRTA